MFDRARQIMMSLKIIQDQCNKKGKKEGHEETFSLESFSGWGQMM